MAVALNHPDLYAEKTSGNIDANNMQYSCGNASSSKYSRKHNELSRRLIDYARPLNREPQFQRGIKRCRGRGLACRSFPEAVQAVFSLLSLSRLLQSTQNFKMNPLLNKTALITGACDGIGKAILEELVSKGLKVIGLARDMNQLKVYIF